MLFDYQPESLRILWRLLTYPPLTALLVYCFMMQAGLVLITPYRKLSPSRWYLKFYSWLVYLMVDAVASLTMGRISKGQYMSCSEEDKEVFALFNAFQAFSASFVLIFLGSADTITAFSLEDNDLWKRYLLQMIFHVWTAGFYFVGTLPDNIFWIPTILMLVAGFIKYADRTYSRYIASWDKLQESLLETRSSKPLGVDTVQIQQQQPHVPVEVVKLNEEQLLKHAYNFIRDFKGLTVELMFSNEDRRRIRDLMLRRTAEDGVKMVEIELNLFYDMLYTRNDIIRGNVVTYLSHALRFTSTILVVISLVIFCSIDKKGIDTFIVGLTRILFAGSLGLDLIIFFRLIMSDWTIASLICPEPCNQSPIPSRRKLYSPANWLKQIICKSYQMRSNWRRWSKSIPQYSLITCASRPLMRKFVVLEIFGLSKIFQEIGLVRREPFGEDLRDFIFNELKRKSEMAADDNAAIDHVNCTHGCPSLTPYVQLDDSYAETIVVWHIATEFCHHGQIIEVMRHSANNDAAAKENQHFHEIARVLSNYMLYLLLMIPKMMSGAAGNKSTRIEGAFEGDKEFKDVLNEMKSLLPTEWLYRNGQGQEQVCPDLQARATKHILDVLGGKTSADETDQEYGRKSVLSKGHQLYKELMKLEAEGEGNKNKWEIMSKVWVGLMSHAASRCKTRAHADQLPQGGQLLTVVWLLMNHLGIGEHFHKY